MQPAVTRILVLAVVVPEAKVFAREKSIAPRIASYERTRNSIPERTGREYGGNEADGAGVVP